VCPDGQGWVKLTDKATGRPYYVHRETKKTSWTRPVAVNPNET
jgi:hypothetical protein